VIERDGPEASIAVVPALGARRGHGRHDLQLRITPEDACLEQASLRLVDGRAELRALYALPPVTRAHGAEGMVTVSDDDRARSIREKLRRAASGSFRPFGSEAHQFRVLPPVAESELQAFERQHAITLPHEYRTFLAVVSRGGAGPAYGLIPFGDPRALADPSRADFLRTPFAFSDAAGAGEPWADVDGYTETLLAGTLALCDEGCGYIHFLVCTGPTRGDMWIDAAVSDGGFVPLRCGFMDWYERWLDDVIAGGDGASNLSR